jgi:Fe-S cluster assembly scaffold protein SufB
MYKSGDTTKAIVIPQDTKFAANIKKNILPNIKMPSGFSIELFAVVPDARHMAVARNKTTVWIGTRKDKVWQATDRDMDDIADTVEQFAPTVKFDIPNGVCFSDDGHLYVAERNRVLWFPAAEYFMESPDTVAVPIISQGNLIPTEEESYNHTARVCAISKKDNKLYVSLGQPFNVAPADKIELYEEVGIGGMIRFNRFPGELERGENGKGGIYNFVTKRGLCKGKNSKISWTQVETGSAITWKYPSCILKGDNSVGEFYSIAITNNHQKADTGTKMIHLGKNTKSKIISKGISAGFSDMTYRGLVDISSKASNSSNYTQCDSLLMGNKCGAHTVPYIKNKNSESNIAHEATTSKISEEQLHYCQQRGLSQEEAVGLIVNGFCKEVLQQLPMEFAVEAQKLVGISLEGSVG